MFKILFITNVPAPYRVDFFSLLGKRCDLTILYEHAYSTERDTQWKGRLQEKTYHEIYLNAKIRIHHGDSFAPQVVKYLSRKYDLIVIGSHSSPTQKLAIEYMKFRGIPYIVNIDGVALPRGYKESAWKGRLKQHLYSGGEAYLVSGDVTKKYLMKYGISDEKIYIYPFSSIFDDEVIERVVSDEEKNLLKRELGVPEKYMVLSVGRFIQSKGYDLLLQAGHDIVGDTGVYIVGGCPTEEYLSLRECCKGKANFHFIEFKTRDVLQKYYQASDVFVLPTRIDAWGLVVNEAAAKGLPIISTDKCNAANEMLEDGVSGYILPSETIDGWADKINTLLENDGLRRDMAEESLEVAKQYTIERMVSVHLDIFAKIMERRETS